MLPSSGERSEIPHCNEAFFLVHMYTISYKPYISHISYFTFLLFSYSNGAFNPDPGPWAQRLSKGFPPLG
jgi:hypothetical protein